VIQKTSSLILAGMIMISSCSQASLGMLAEPNPQELARLIIPKTGTAQVETWLQNRADPRLIAGLTAEVLYKGPLGTQNIWLHYGINGWKEIRTIPMTPAMENAGAVKASFVPPLHARSLEFAFVRRDGRGEWWDNNNSQDWQTDVYASVSVASYSGGESPSWRLTYLGTLAKPLVHVGRDGWKSIQTLPMYVNGTIERNTGIKEYWLDIPAGNEEQLDWCFTDGNGNWDNNNGRNWRAIKSYLRADLWPSAQSGYLYYPDLIGKPVHAFFNGRYVTQAPLTLRHSGGYFYADFQALQSGDWIFVLDETVNGVRYYAELRTRLDKTGLNLTLPIIIK